LRALSRQCRERLKQIIEVTDHAGGGRKMVAMTLIERATASSIIWSGGVMT
jgi:hypothetical protein